MNFSGLVYLLIAHYLCGRGVLRLAGIQQSHTASACLSLLIGVPVLSLVPCFIQLLHIPIEAYSVSFGIAIATLLLSIPLLMRFKPPRFIRPSIPAMYEWPFLFAVLLMLALSAWRAFYLPPLSRDMLTGPEMLAEFAVKEKTMISSVFTIDLSTTNNYFKSPYITGLQIVYKLLVCPFGQVWLSVLAFSFTGWLYTILRARLHPFLAGFLLFSFMAIPELYAYTYMMLYDYSNMIFFFCGFYFLTRYITQSVKRDLVFSALLFGLATYIRTETIILVSMFTPLLIWSCYQNRESYKKAVGRIGLFLLIPAAFYVLCTDVFIRLFIPVHFDLSGQFNPDLADVSVFFHRLYDIGAQLLFSKMTLRLFGSFFYFFLVVLIADIIWPRRFNREALISLYGIAVVYVGLTFLGYLFPLVDIHNTTKRGFFKLLPIILLYLSNSGLLLCLSAKIIKWAGRSEK